MAAIVLHAGNKHIPSTFDLQGGTATVDFTSTEKLVTLPTVNFTVDDFFMAKLIDRSDPEQAILFNETMKIEPVSISAELFSNTARAAVGTIPPPKVSISNLGNTLSKFLPTSATTIGQLETIPLTFISPQKAAAVNTPVVITLPAYTNCVGRLQATYTYV